MQLIIVLIFRQPPPSMNVNTKMNGEGNNSSNNNKGPLPQRTLRQYTPQPTTPVAYTEPPPSLGPQVFILRLYNPYFFINYH